MLAIPTVESSCPPVAASVTVVALRDAIDARLVALLGPPVHADDRIACAMRYGTLAPGKRLRPLLMLLTARALGVDPASLMDAACALEMVHAASLFLDDLPCMDDADLRRGLPTVHLVYGEDVATLGAVALLATAWRLAANAPALDPVVRVGMVTVLSDAVGLEGLVAGQYRDLHRPSSPCIASVQRTNHQKTSVLFEAAFEIACLAADSDATTRQCLKAAARELGQAYQLIDDLSDLELTAAQTGKDAHQDAGKATLVALMGPALARQKLADHRALVQEHLWQALPFDNDVTSLTDALFVRSGLA